jgi:hypothetical protein
MHKSNPFTGRGGLQGCEASMLSHFLDNQLTGGGKVASLTRRPLFTSPLLQEDYWYSFLFEDESTPGP